MVGTLNYKLVLELKKAQKKTNQDILDYFFENGVIISEGGIKNWFRKDDSKRTSPELKNVVLLASFFNVSVDSLVDGSPFDKVPIAIVPIVGEASCGLPVSNAYQEVDRATYYNGNNWHKDLYGVIACGDSMSPDVDDGDEAICDPRANIESGDIVHYTLNRESAIKIYYNNIDLNAIELIPYNKTQNFKTLYLPKDDERLENFKMVKIVTINKIKMNNKGARLKMIGKK